MEEASLPSKEQHIPERPYNDKVNKEDLLLYLLTTALISFFIYFFWQLQKENNKPVFTEQDERMFSNLQLKDSAAYLDMRQEFLKAQLQMVYKRYEFSSRLSRSIVYIKFIGFLVGTILVLFGAMIVVRGIRDHGINVTGAAQEKGNFSVVTHSPGVWITLIGAVIMIATILKGVEANMSDTGIAFPLYNNLPQQMNEDTSIIIHSVTQNPQ
jgi:hypothetical protein